MPRTTFADVQSDSDPDTSITHTITRAISLPTHCKNPRWNSAVVSDEKKITVGNTVMAKGGPSGKWAVSQKNVLKTNFDPSSEHVMILVMTTLACSKTFRPGGLQRSNTPTANCRATPLRISRKFIRLRFSETNQAKSNIVNRPTKLTRRPISTPHCGSPRGPYRSRLEAAGPVPHCV